MSCVCMGSKELAAKEKAMIHEVISKKCISPTLAVILIGGDPASSTYVRGKKNDCNECGIKSEVYHFNDTVTQDCVLELIYKLNRKKEISGILVQLPLPKHIDKRAVIEAIDPKKDVDCFHSSNIGKLFLGEPIFIPCTPYGITDLLNAYKIDISGKNCTVIGRSDIVGKPMALLLTQLGGTVTVCHSDTKDVAEHTRQADIIVCAVGKPNFLTADMVKNGAVIVDVGINRSENGEICGDVDFENVSKKCSAITPVPGGVGLMTRVALLKNTLKAYALGNS